MTNQLKMYRLQLKLIFFREEGMSSLANCVDHKDQKILLKLFVDMGRV